MLGATIVIIAGGALVFWLNFKPSASAGGAANSSFPGIKLGDGNKFQVLQNKQFWVLIWILLGIAIIWWVDPPQIVKNWWTGTPSGPATTVTPGTTGTTSVSNMPLWVLTPAVVGALAILGGILWIIFGKAEGVTVRLRQVFLVVLGIAGIVFAIKMATSIDWSNADGLLSPAAQAWAWLLTDFHVYWVLAWALVLISLPVSGFTRADAIGVGWYWRFGTFVATIFILALPIIASINTFMGDRADEFHEGLQDQIIQRVTGTWEATVEKRVAGIPVKQYFPSSRTLPISIGKPEERYMRPGEVYTVKLRGEGWNCPHSQAWTSICVDESAFPNVDIWLRPGITEDTLVDLSVVKEGQYGCTRAPKAPSVCSVVR